jgi:excisionase family DNA binding protein
VNNKKKNTPETTSSIHPSAPAVRPLAVLTAAELEDRFWEAVECYPYDTAGEEANEERSRLKQQLLEMKREYAARRERVPYEEFWPEGLPEPIKPRPAGHLRKKPSSSGQTGKANSSNDERTPAPTPATWWEDPGETAEPTKGRKGDRTLLDEKESVHYLAAASYLGVSRRHIQRLVKSGKLKSRGDGHNKTISVESLTRYLLPKK